MVIAESDQDGAPRAFGQAEALEPAALLDLWDRCTNATLPDRARMMLRASYPRVRADDLEAMAIGKWNRALLDFRAAQFGTELQVFDRCPHCKGSVEFTIETGQIVPKSDPDAAEREFSTGDWNVRFRPLTGGDWLHSSRLGVSEATEAGKRLLRRALLQVSYGTNSVPSEEMPDSAWEALADALVEVDSGSEILFHLRCPRCTEEWDSPLEPVDFLWREINAACRRLLRQIHVLATAYGWSESEILGLSQERRANYLQLIEESGTVPNG